MVIILTKKQKKKVENTTKRKKLRSRTTDLVIYCATNKYTGLKYIGLTTRGLQHRKKTHWRSVEKGSKTYFHNALRKYKLNGFNWKILERVNNIDKLAKREIHYISEYNTYKEGYNSTLGGEVPFKTNRFKKSKKTKRPDIYKVKENKKFREYQITTPDNIKIKVIRLKDYCRNNLGAYYLKYYKSFKACIRGELSEYKGYQCQLV